jgi:hypothetical protein
MPIERSSVASADGMNHAVESHNGICPARAALERPNRMPAVVCTAALLRHIASPDVEIGTSCGRSAPMSSPPPTTDKFRGILHPL